MGHVEDMMELEPLFQKQSITSTKAAKSLDKNKLAERAKELVRLLKESQHGLTDEELQTMMNLSGNSERPLRVQLQRKGFVYDSGNTRKTASGREAVLWKAKEGVKNE